MFVVERAQGEDALRLARLAHDSLRERFDERWWTQQLALGDCFVARDRLDGDVLGFAVAHKEDACEAELSALAVQSMQRGRGVGEALLKTVQTDLRRSGAFRIHLDVRADDVRAREFYQRHGYVTEGLRDDAYADGASALRMSRPI